MRGAALGLKNRGLRGRMVVDGGAFGGWCVGMVRGKGSGTFCH